MALPPLALGTFYSLIGSSSICWGGYNSGVVLGNFLSTAPGNIWCSAIVSFMISMFKTFKID
jgi:hypothetical protein